MRYGVLRSVDGGFEPPSALVRLYCPIPSDAIGRTGLRAEATVADAAFALARHDFPNELTDVRLSRGLYRACEAVTHGMSRESLALYGTAGDASVSAAVAAHLRSRGRRPR